MPTLPQQPSNVTELLSASFKLYVEGFTKFIGYSLIIFAFNRLLSFFVADLMPLDPNLDQDQQIATVMQALPVLLGVIIVAALFSCVLYSAMIYRVDNVANGRDDDFMELIVLSTKKIPAVLLSGILYAIAITVGTLLLVVPGVILMISLMFCWYFILLEDMGAYDALMASHRLVWGDWWRTNMVFFVPALVFLLFFFIVGFLVALGGFLGNTNPVLTHILDIGSDLLAAVVSPYFYVLVYLQYRDLKLRKNL
jgi:hypothetical protein